MAKISTAQIGRCGELLVQYHLLLLGIESAPMTTDTGIDLVAYVPGSSRATTIQVKTGHKAKPGGGKGKLALDWWVPADTPAEFVIFIGIELRKIWIFRPSELESLAQQKSNGRYHLYMYVDPTARPRTDRPAHIHEFDSYLFEKRASELFV